MLEVNRGERDIMTVKKEKTLHEELMEGFEEEQNGITEETDRTTD